MFALTQGMQCSDWLDLRHLPTPEARSEVSSPQWTWSKNGGAVIKKRGNVCRGRETETDVRYKDQLSLLQMPNSCEGAVHMNR